MKTHWRSHKLRGPSSKSRCRKKSPIIKKAFHVDPAHHAETHCAKKHGLWRWPRWKIFIEKTTFQDCIFKALHSGLNEEYNPVHVHVKTAVRWLFRRWNGFCLMWSFLLFILSLTRSFPAALSVEDKSDKIHSLYSVWKCLLNVVILVIVTVLLCWVVASNKYTYLSALLKYNYEVLQQYFIPWLHHISEGNIVL